MSLQLIRKFCMISLPILLFGSSMLYFYMPSIPWTDAIYTISLTANIGYFTNYIAIKMLFKPHYKTAFGRQGLIPKNQDKLAESLSHTLIENFLSKEQWREYLCRSDLINKVLAEAKISSKNWLLKEKNILSIEHFLKNYLVQNQQLINHHLNRIQKDLVKEFTQQLDAQELLSSGFEWLEKQFDRHPEKMQMMIEPIIKTIAENIPEIAHGLSNALDAHIDEQDTLKRGIAKMAKWSADFDTDDIKRYLFRLVASFEFRETLFNGLKTLVSEYKEKPMLDLSSDSNDAHPTADVSFSMILEKFISSNLEQLNWTQMITKQLFPPTFNSKTRENNLTPIILSIHQVTFDNLESKLSEGPLHNWVINELVSMIEKLDLRQMVKDKAKAFTPEKMENIFQNMISEHLIFIELLGALLGALSGFALVDIRLFIGLTGLLASFYLLDYFLTRSKTLVSTE